VTASAALPLVSIVIPCYNQGRFLAEAIRSVQCQTYPEVETIVVDDGSTDETAIVARSSPPAHLVSLRNSGAAVARNVGMRHSRGEYLVFLDADDRLLPDAVETGVAWLTAQERWKFVTGHVRLITEDGDPAGTPPQVHGDSYVDLLRSNYIWSPGAVMYRRDALDAGGPFDPAAGGSADYELNIRLARGSAFGCHHQIVLEYRQHRGSMSANSRYMLRSAVAVRRAQRRHVRADRNAREALEAGIRIAQADYGDRVVTEVKADLRTPRRWLEAFRGTACLLRFYPAAIMRGLIGPIARLRRQA
jgi:glycosyltransferase involved in cell wall biosynthesis